MKISRSIFNKFAVRGALLLLGLFLFVFYIYPPFLLFFQSGDGFNGLRRQNILVPLLNSLRLSISVFAATGIIGGLLAVAAVRVNGRLRKIIDRGVLVSFAVPPYILALAWVQIFGRNGYLERIVHSLGFAENWHSCPYSLTASAVVMTLHLYPLMYMSIRNGLERLDPRYEQAALLAGASAPRVLCGITLPLVLPNILSTGLLVFSRTMANFSVPALLCLPAGIDLVPTGIYSALSSLRTNQAALFSIVLVSVSTVLHIAHGALLRSRQRESCFSGGQADVYRGVRGRKAAGAAVFCFFTIACVIPLAAMAVSSFLLRWGLPLEPKYFTLNNYREIFSGSGDAARAFGNSFLYGGTAALFAVIVGGAAAFVSARRKTPGGRLIEAAASWPMAVPNTVLAVAAVFAWNRPPLRFYGTGWAIILTYMVLFTPIVLKQISGLAETEDGRLTAAARTAGAGGVKAFFTVSFPLVLPGIFSGLMICMMIALREIPISLMLYSAGRETVGVLLFGMQSQSYGLEMTSALAVVLIVIILAGNRLVELFSGGKK